MSAEADKQFSANSIRLSWKEWGVTALLCLLALGLLPAVWSRVETFDPGPDFRMSYDISSDYWLFQKWVERAAGHYPYLVLGDSVVWGHYGGADETLCAYLDEQTGSETFADLGVDGIHPLAMEGLVRYYGRAVRGTRVMINLNFLWMSSPRFDLSTAEETDFNHPRLVPQVCRRPAAYHPAFGDVANILLERYTGFFSWKAHMQTAYYTNFTLPQYTLEFPDDRPWTPLANDLPPLDEDPMDRPVPWFERGIQPADFDWVALDDSLQWAAFQRTVDLLRSRGNDVFVLCVPFNPFMLTEAGRIRYQGLQGGALAWLSAEKIPYHCADYLEEAEYADASHPLPLGYERIAEHLLADPAFAAWMGEEKSGEEPEANHE